MLVVQIASNLFRFEMFVAKHLEGHLPPAAWPAGWPPGDHFLGQYNANAEFFWTHLKLPPVLLQ